MRPERLSELVSALHGYLEAQGRDPARFPIYANAGIAITPSADTQAWKFTAPNGAVAVHEVDRLVERLREFDRIGVQHLRIGFHADSPAGQLELLQQVAQKVLPALR